MTREYFTEEQQMDRLKSLLIVLPGFIIAGVVFGIGIYRQIVLDELWGDKPMSDTGLVVTAIIVLLFITGMFFLMRSSRLIVSVRSDGIWFRYPPIISKEKHLPRDTIASYEIRKYHAQREYGGRGIKQRRFRYGKAYTIAGNIGLQLILKDGKKILFGTRRPEALLRAMNKMMGGQEII
ncbi:MAG: hypothetical protein JW861_11790 [Bacteroidales bacterium]|nr:hypothetical protein [Bacteroidales bacterium]